MTLPASPNQTIPLTIKRGQTGWPVFALQRALASAGARLAADGDFGPVTESVVTDYQRAHALVADGLAGPKTQQSLCERVARDVGGLPTGLGRSIIDGESSYLLGAVNWSVAGGVDCGIIQRRVVGPPFDLAALKAAYDPSGSLAKALEELAQRAAAYRDAPGVRTRPDRGEYAYRLALLAHNWPWAAGELAAGRALSTTKEATWATAIGVRFPDGQRVFSYRDWAEFYALGGSHGPARMARFVTAWPA